MPPYELAGQSARDSENEAANPSRLLNMYRERVLVGGRTQYALRNVLGQDAKDNIGDVPIRAMGRANSQNWLVGGGNLYSVDSAGQTSNVAALADDTNTTIAGNYSDVTVAAGGRYFVYDGAVSEPTGGAFSDVGSVCYVGGYSVLTERNGKRFQWTGQGNAKSLDGLHFASADQVDDNILRGVDFQGNLILFCETSTEIWQISGTGNKAFSYVTTKNIGLKDFNLLVRFDDALFFIGHDSRAYLFGAGVASSAAVETSITKDTPTHCFYFEDQGHKHCVVRFEDRPAWVFDVSEQEWHERSETAGHGPWSAVCSMRNGRAWLVGNDGGGVMELARTSMDRSGPLYRRVVGYTVYTGEKFSPRKLELLGRVGEHNLSEAVDFAWGFGGGVAWEIAPGIAWNIGSVPSGPRSAYVSLSESGDGGKTWRGPFRRSMGGAGEYDKRMIWRARGQFQQYTPRFDISEPADITLYANGILE